MRLLLAICLTVLPMLVNASNDVARATMVIGTPKLVGSEREALIAQGDRVSVGQRLVTGTGGHVHLRFNDGTLVSVRPNSELQIETFEGDDQSVASFRLRLVEGTARAISGSGLKSSRERFRLNTPIAAIGIRGTDFTTNSSTEGTQVRVHTGEIVMTPLGPGCTAQALGPCATDRSVSLAADDRSVIRLRFDGAVPEVIQVDDRLSEASVMPAQSRRMRSVIAGSEDESDFDEQSELTALNQELTEAQITELDVRAEPFLDTEDDFDTQDGPLVWGHWFNVPEGDDWSEPATALLRRYDPTVSNSVYGLFRDPAFSGLVQPAQNEVSLKLSAADATLALDGLTTRAAVTEGILFLDFETRSFVSKLSVATDRAGDVGLEGVGVISPTGIFVSKSSSDRMAGALASDGREAGMLFEKRVGAGVVQGITLWEQ